ncbi:MAG: response regulator transcription factor [Bacteroidetes bacterium]|nr:response regulator transcription factor [Bacteroidota bacterium]
MKLQDKIRIAIADDHEILRTGLIRIFETEAMFEIDIEAMDGVELVDKISKASTKPDICILDIRMPKMNGYEALKTIKQSWPDIKVIILTISHTEYTILKTLNDGASACLPKDINTIELIEAVKHVYKNGIYLTDFDARLLSSSILEKKKKIKLSRNEITYLNFACTSLTHKEIAKEMGVSDRTIDSYRDALCDKLDLKNRIELAVFAIESGIRQVAGLKY